MGTPPSNDPSPIDATTWLVNASGSTIIAERPDTAVLETFRKGDVIDGKYLVERVYGGSGKSGMGVVYIVSIGGRTLALKSIQRRYAKDLNIVERFLREARSWMLLGFLTHVVHAYRIDIIDARPFLFLEYIAPDERGAVSLADYLKQGALPVEKAMRFGIHCAEGMRRATASLPDLVHRDLKPENLLVTRQEILKVTDFGLVRTPLARDPMENLKVDPGDGLTALGGGALGTPAYMAPEQFDSAQCVGPAADIYAFGCCFYEAIAGRRVFSVEGKSGLEAVLEYRDQHRNRTPEPLRDIAPDCPPELEALLMRCIEKKPEQRWPDWAALHDALLDLYERHCGACYLNLPAPEPSAMEVAVQVQSLTLLDGYSRAVHLRNLRERHDASPYAFHLALASYFHCHDEPDEAQRQLERAVAMKGDHDGYEAVGRLAAYYIEGRRLKEAEKLLADYLNSHPDGTERVLEAVVQLRIARNDAEGAIALLEPYQQSWRGRALKGDALKAAGHAVELHALVQREFTNTLNLLRESIAAVANGDVPAWARAGDPELLCEVLDELDSGLDSSAIARAAHSYWPDLEGYPDFATPMALLGWLFGELAALELLVPAKDRSTYARLAERLDHPHRTNEIRERDERWLWDRGE